MQIVHGVTRPLNGSQVWLEVWWGWSSSRYMLVINWILNKKCLSISAESSIIFRCLSLLETKFVHRKMYFRTFRYWFLYFWGTLREIYNNCSNGYERQLSNWYGRKQSDYRKMMVLLCSKRREVIKKIFNSVLADPEE